MLPPLHDAHESMRRVELWFPWNNFMYSFEAKQRKLIKNFPSHYAWALGLVVHR